MGEQFELGGIEPRNQRRSIQFAGKRERIARADRFVNSYTQLWERDGSRDASTA